MPRMKRSFEVIILGIFVFIFFLFFQAQGNYNGDSGDLIVAAYQFGVPHPPGYPLYTFLAWLFTQIPYQTVAWRVGLLSNFSQTLTVCFVWLSVCALTKNRLAAFVASLMLLGNYVFFLYAITAEVFGLFNLFVSLLSYVLIMWVKTKKKVYWYFSIFLFGLALSHHHVIIFLSPALWYIWWKHKTIYNLQDYVYSILLFCIGLIPYVYIPIAAKGNAIINWNHVDSIDSFIKLITRAYYGTFQSGGTYGESFYQRFLQLKAFTQFYSKDVGLFGICLLGFGIMYLRRKKTIFWFFTLAFLSMGPFFLFYASFPLLGYFSLATYERFLLPSYIFTTILAGVGCNVILLKANDLFSSHFSRFAIKIFVTFALLLFVSFRVLKTTYGFIGIATDRTADQLGLDYLNSVKENGILLLSFDTSLFTTQYVRYALGQRSDVSVIHLDRLTQPEYKKALHKYYPQLVIPSIEKATKVFDFIDANKNRFIYANSRIPVPDTYVWVPYGLLYKLEETQSISDLTPIIDENKKLWSSYQNPNNGILSLKMHMMLADIPNTYARARLEYGKILLKAEKVELAKEQFGEAVKLHGDSTIAEALTQLALSQLLLKECFSVFSTFDSLNEYRSFIPAEAYLYESIAYRECKGDEKKADELKELYNKKKQMLQTSLSNF